MRFFSRLKISFIAMCLCIAMSAFAEQAPVYDADNLPPQFDSSPNNPTDQNQSETVDLLPPPPSPTQTPPSSSPTSAPLAEETDVPNQVVMPRQPPQSVAQHLNQIDQQIVNLQNNNSSARLDSLQNEIQGLRSEVEQLTHQLQQLQSQQRSMYSDFDKRLAQQSEIRSKPKPVESPNRNDDNPIVSLTPTKVAKIAQSEPQEDPVKKSDAQPNVAEEQQIYQTAYTFIKEKKYNDAVNALQKMLQKYPSGQFASNAHYWLGELYGLMGKNDQALIEFDTVVSTYPDSPRVSDAQLKVGLIYAAQLKWRDAKSAFKKVINRYPGTASARLASEQIKQLRQAGH